MGAPVGYAYPEVNSYGLEFQRLVVLKDHLAIKGMQR